MEEGLRGGKAEASRPGYENCVRERGDRGQLDQSIEVRKTSDLSGGTVSSDQEFQSLQLPDPIPQPFGQPSDAAILTNASVSHEVPGPIGQRKEQGWEENGGTSSVLSQAGVEGQAGPALT